MAVAFNFIFLGQMEQSLMGISAKVQSFDMIPALAWVVTKQQMDMKIEPNTHFSPGGPLKLFVYHIGRMV